MKIFTIHAPMNRGVNDPSRYAFVRDGFHVWAFFLAPLWMFLPRLWLVLFGYVAIIVVIELALTMIGINALAGSWISLLFGFLVGLEASTLRRWTLARRGWNQIATVAARNLIEAEQRFYAGAATVAAKNSSAPSVATVSSGRGAFSAPQAIIGLFPQPQNPAQNPGGAQ